MVSRNGGKVLGTVRHPLTPPDFSSFLLQAQASKAKIIGLANAGGDTINSIKQAAEFGIVKGGQKLAGLLVFITDVHALGLQTAQGLILTETLLLGPATTRRAPSPSASPTQIDGKHADDGPGRRLRGDAALPEGGRGARRATTARKVVAKMKEMPTDDPLFGKGTHPRRRPQDPHMYLFEVKKPSESKGPWDYYKLRRDDPGRPGVPAARPRATARW